MGKFRSLFFILIVLVNVSGFANNSEFANTAKFKNEIDSAQKVLDEVLADPQFNSTYIYNGCFIRAHRIAFELTKIGWKPFKIFLTVQGENKIYFPHKNSQKRAARWSYHVVTAVEFDQEKWIFDPTLAHRILKLEDWLSHYKNINENNHLLFKIETVSVSELTPEKQFNDEFKLYGHHFSLESMDYIDYEMENLFMYEKVD